MKKNPLETAPVNPQEINIEMNEEIAEGTYSNLSIISHSHSEFIVDFINIMPNTQKSRVKARIILTPQNIKRLARAIRENIQKFEDTHGVIQDSEPVEIPIHMGHPIAQA